MPDRLAEMETFVCIVEGQNLVAAAGEMGVSTAFVTRRLQELEQRLKLRLLTRTTRRISLTDAGRRYYAFARKILKEIREEERALTETFDAPKGVIKINSPVSFGISEMGKAVSEFMVQFPLIEISLMIGDSRHRKSDSLEQDADVSLQFVRPRNTSLHARVIGRIKWALCASPNYLKKKGAPKEPRDLLSHSCLVTSKPHGDGTWTLSGPNGVEKIKVSGVVTPNSAITMRFMALDATGIALLPKFCIAGDLAEKKLVPVLPQYSGIDQPKYAC